MTQDRIDEITAKFEAESSTELVEATVEDAPQDVEVIKYQSMADDLNYMIEKLKNNIDNSERILNRLALDMLDEPEDIDAMTLRYTSIDAGMNKNLELLQKARKDISIVMANLAKAKAGKIEIKKVVNNTVNVGDGGAFSTTDIIGKLKRGD